MKGIFGLLTGVILLVCFSSCQKEIEWNLSNKTQSDSIHISKWVVLDTTYATGLDTSELFEFTYDASRRLSKMSQYYFTPGTAVRETRRDYYYLFNGADTVPSRLIDDYHQLLVPGGYTDTAYYSYQNGIIIKDSSVELGGYYVNTYYRLSPSRFRIIKLLVGLPPVLADTCYSNITWQGQNLVAEIDSEFVFQPPVLVNVAHNQITYDTKPNPLRRLFVPYPVPFYPTIIYHQYLSQFLITPSANNVVSWTDDAGIYSCSYIYDAIGYPRVARISDRLNHAQCHYYYISL